MKNTISKTICHITKIMWDTSDDDSEGYIPSEKLGLPTEVDIPLDKLDLETYHISDAIVEYLSDIFGYCISQLSIVLISKED